MPGRGGSRVWSWVAGAVLGLGLAGCHVPAFSRVELAVQGADGREERHFAEFPEASYQLSPGGGLELVLRSERPSTIDPTQTISQILYVRSFWRPIPGTTRVEATQINARVQYAVLTPPTGVRYDGGGFLSYEIDDRTGELTGRIESGAMAPRFRMGDAVEPFGSARLSGAVRAAPRPRAVVEAVQMLESQFSQLIEP